MFKKKYGRFQGRKSQQTVLLSSLLYLENLLFKYFYHSSSPLLHIWTLNLTVTFYSLTLKLNAHHASLHWFSYPNSDLISYFSIKFPLLENLLNFLLCSLKKLSLEEPMLMPHQHQNIKKIINALITVNFIFNLTVFSALLDMLSQLSRKFISILLKRFPPQLEKTLLTKFSHCLSCFVLALSY